MRNAKGFTVIEMMVGSFILLIVILITTSFFRAQSQYSGELMKDTGVRESVGIATTMIRRDIMQAGQGLAEKQQLSLWPDAYSGDLFHRLRLACGYYLTYYVPGSPLTPPTAPTPPIPPIPQVPPYNPFQDRWFQNVGSFTLPYVRPEDVHGILTFVKSPPTRSFIPVSGAYDVSNGYTTFTVNGSAGTTPFVPVITYALVDPDTLTDQPPYSGSGSEYLELRRNGLTLMGGRKDSTVRLQDFGVRLQFVDLSGNDVWIPSTTSGTDINVQSFENLKGVEIQLKYQTLRSGQDRTKAYNWRTQLFKIVTVVPRNVFWANTQ